MKDALLHMDNAIEVLRRSAGSPAVISVLEDVRASLMHDIFGVTLAPHHILADWPKRDWTLGPDEPMPHHGEARLPILDRS